MNSQADLNSPTQLGSENEIGSFRRPGCSEADSEAARSHCTYDMAVKVARTRSYILVWILSLALVFQTTVILYASMEERERWSIDFENAPLSDVLRELTKITGVKIITESTLSNRLFTKSYKNQTIEEILKDIFRNVNYASVWHYKENHLDSISIRIFDASQVGPEGSSHAERVQRKPFGYRRSRDREAQMGEEGSLSGEASSSRTNRDEEPEESTDESETEVDTEDSEERSSDENLGDEPKVSATESEVESVRESSREGDSPVAPESDNEKSDSSTPQD